MAALIDTSIFIDAERQRMPVADLLTRLPDEPALAAITASELVVGIHHAHSEARRLLRQAFVDDVIGALPVVAFDLDIARVHARLSTEMRRAGVQIGQHDLQIAATAITLGYDLLTTNLRDFRRVHGLQVQSLENLT
jgi:tRNA(fMet)-specific endonuclease VapC